jgi:hypothetical protein
MMMHHLRKRNIMMIHGLNKIIDNDGLIDQCQIDSRSFLLVKILYNLLVERTTIKMNSSKMICAK